VAEKNDKLLKEWREDILCLSSKWILLWDQLQQAQPSLTSLIQTFQQLVSSIYFWFFSCPGFHSIWMFHAFKYIWHLQHLGEVGGTKALAL